MSAVRLSYGMAASSRARRRWGTGEILETRGVWIGAWVGQRNESSVEENWIGEEEERYRMVERKSLAAGGRRCVWMARIVPWHDWWWMRGRDDRFDPVLERKMFSQGR